MESIRTVFGILLTVSIIISIICTAMAFDEDNYKLYKKPLIILYSLSLLFLFTYTFLSIHIDNYHCLCVEKL